MTTIVQFPTNRIVREVQPNIEEIEKAKEKSLQRHAETIVEDLFLNIMDAMENYGIDVETEQFERDFTFSADAIRATVYRTFGIDHGLHDFINTNVQIVKAENYDDLREKMKEMLAEDKEVVDKPE
jgi:hypothetical protein